MSGDRLRGFTAWKGHAVLSFLARALLAVVFIWAAIHKVVHPGEFALTVATYQILPLSLINLQAIGLPWVELLVGLTLLVGLWTRESALVTVGMNVMFIVAILVTLYRGEEILCGCFASEEAGHEIGWDLVFRDFGLMLAGLYVIWTGPRWPSMDSLLARRRRGGER
jgi:uncharacterized membrane protein YphA (DoxX/SURF4 family)